MDFNIYDLDISDEYKEIIIKDENPIALLSDIISNNQKLKSIKYRNEMMEAIAEIFESGDSWSLEQIHNAISRKGFTGKAKSIENRLYESGIYFYSKFDKKWRNHR